MNENRFFDNNTGTIYDRQTNLVWLKNPMAINPTSWLSASQLCSRLKHGDYLLNDHSYLGEWRLPSIHEFMTIIDYNMQEPALHEYFCNCVPPPLPGVYWTSNRLISFPNRSWCVDLFNGRVFYEYTGKAPLPNLRIPIYMERFISLDSFENAEYVAFVWPVKNARNAGRVFC
jgi:hypothetical protein